VAAQERAYRDGIRFGGVVLREVSTGIFADRGRRVAVIPQPRCCCGQCARIVIGDCDAGVPQWKCGGSPFHGNHGELPRECVEHLDRESAFGSPWNPGQVACGVYELPCLLAVDAADIDGICHAYVLGESAGRIGVRFGGDEQTRHRVAVSQEGEASMRCSQP